MPVPAAVRRAQRQAGDQVEGAALPRGGSVKTSCSSQSTREKSKRSAQAGKNTWKNSAKNVFNNDLNRWSWSAMARPSAGASGLSLGRGAVARNYATQAVDRQVEDRGCLRSGPGRRDQESSSPVLPLSTVARS